MEITARVDIDIDIDNTHTYIHIPTCICGPWATGAYDQYAKTDHTDSGPKAFCIHLALSSLAFRSGPWYQTLLVFG